MNSTEMDRLMACVILSLKRNKFSKEYTNFVKAMTREESAWVHYWSNIYYDLVSAYEAVPWETLGFVNCVLKGALFQYNDATMKAIEILRYFKVPYDQILSETSVQRSVPERQP
jgi:hypothetical protein